VAKKKKFRLLLPRWPLPLLKPLRPLPPLLLLTLLLLLTPLPLLLTLLLPPLRLLKLPSNSWQAAQKNRPSGRFFFACTSLFRRCSHQQSPLPLATSQSS